MIRPQPVLLRVSILVTALSPKLLRKPLDLLARRRWLCYLSHVLFFLRGLAWLRGGLRLLPCICHFTFLRWIRRQRMGLPFSIRKFLLPRDTQFDSSTFLFNFAAPRLLGIRAKRQPGTHPARKPQRATCSGLREFPPSRIQDGAHPN